MNFKAWLIFGIVVAGAVVAGWQFQTAAGLRIECDQARAEATSMTGIAAEHERLRAAQVSPGEVVWSAADDDGLKEARAEVATLREKIARAARRAEEKSTSSERLAVGRDFSAVDWTNAGSATPQAALETALWAGAGGDVNALADEILIFDGNSKRAAQALWETLPEAMRQQYSSPERMIAFFTVRDVPLGSVTVRDFKELNDWPAPAAQMNVVLTSADRTWRAASLVFMNPGNGWKLVVTPGVIAKYAAQLKSADGASASGK